jgi:hypothetical protein
MTVAFTALFVFAAIVTYMRLRPVGADRARVQRLDGRVLKGLALVYVAAAALLIHRGPTLSAAVDALVLFTLLATPPYLLGAALLRSRLLSPGKPTVGSRNPGGPL